MRYSLPILGLLLLAGRAHAVWTPVNPLGEWSSSSSLGLQGIIDARGNTLVNISSDADQLDDSEDSWWVATDSVASSMVIEVAGYAPTNAFGIYNAFNPTQKTVIFAGAAAAGSTTTIASPYSVFGFFLTNSTHGFTWYSDSSLNAGYDQMVAYRGKGQMLNLGSSPSSPTGTVAWCENSYLLGWEDLARGDSDYNDMVVVVKDVKPVPDAASSLGLLGAVLVGLIVVRRRFSPFPSRPS